jgi:hypothetical protein
MRRNLEEIKVLQNQMQLKKPSKKTIPKGNNKVQVVEKVKFNFENSKKTMKTVLIIEVLV